MNSSSPDYVAPRMGRVSRNARLDHTASGSVVAPRMGRVSRNVITVLGDTKLKGRAPHGACE